MPLTDVADWLDENSRPDIVWYVKRLAANDTLATGSHQAGPYIAKEFLFRVFPSIHKPEADRPDAWFDLFLDSHAYRSKARVVWYNRKTRNEARITNLGGSESALLDPDSTGALTIFAFTPEKSAAEAACHVWVCRDGTEEDLVEERVGPVEPGAWLVWSVEAPQDLFSMTRPARLSCWLDPAEIPHSWLSKFPSGSEIIAKAMELRSLASVAPDLRLIKRRDCEFEIFRSVEHAVELPRITAGFTTVDEFITKAQAILQRRKARSGRSLELHVREILIEEGLVEGADFTHGAQSEPGKRPDFLFPSAESYKNPDFPSAQLRMLAVKTTCKDRWRQILNEADRIKSKHLLTLQEGISEGQHREMTEAGVQLVVPTKLVEAFPKSVRPHLQSLESFIGDIRLLRQS